MTTKYWLEINQSPVRGLRRRGGSRTRSMKPVGINHWKLLNADLFFPLAIFDWAKKVFIEWVRNQDVAPSGCQLQVKDGKNVGRCEQQLVMPS